MVYAEIKANSVNTDFANVKEICESIICLMWEVEALQPDLAARRFSGSWHQPKRHGISLYLRSDTHRGAFAWRCEVWRRKRMFLALCPRGSEGIDVQEYRPGGWVDEVLQLGDLAILRGVPGH